MNIQLAILSLTMNNDVCRLILTSTNDGNISEMFDYYFDEQTIDGHYRQTELQFYQQIMQSMNISIGNEILLISNYGRGMWVCVCVWSIIHFHYIVIFDHL